MHVFYTPNIAGKQHYLDEQESKHCIQVLRMAVGDKILLLDGHGGKYTASITSANKKQVILAIDEHQQMPAKPFSLHIAIAPTKNIDRFEWFLEKATEIGISVITPLNCERSERKMIKHERSEKVITAAVKQSMNAYHPELREMTDLKVFLAQSGLPKQRFIAHCIDSERSYISSVLNKDEDCLILIGPEGDFTQSEIPLALQFGFKPITLGNTRLRTETAALAACLEVNLINR